MIRAADIEVEGPDGFGHKFHVSRAGVLLATGWVRGSREDARAAALRLVTNLPASAEMDADDAARVGG